MSAIIYKYQMPVMEDFIMNLPVGANIIRVADIEGMLYLWAIVNPDLPSEPRRFMAYKTGSPMTEDYGLEYIGFCAINVQMELGLYIFEVVE